MIVHLGYFVGIICLMASSAFFSGVEMAFVSVNKIRLKHLADVGNPKANLVRSLQERSDEVLTSILVGNNISVILATALFTLWIYPVGAARAEWLATLIMTPLVLVFAEIIPKVIFRYQANQLIFVLIEPLHIFFRLVRPLAILFLGIAENRLTAAIPRKTTSRHLFVSKEELRHLIKEGQQEGFLEPHERRIIERIFEFGVITVKEVMTRRAHIVSISDKATVDEAREIFRRRGYTRLPVEGKVPGAYIGLVHVLDCLFADADTPVRDLARNFITIDEDTVVQKSLIQMRVRKQRMVGVQNSQGQTIGLVTVQDLIAV